MMRIAITGGIGSGKTTATNHLQSLGFEVVDADEALTHVTCPGAPTLQAIVDAFGSGAVNDDGSYNRKFISDLAFGNPVALQRLNAITHGPIADWINQELTKATGKVVFVAIPLFREEHRGKFALDEAWAILAPSDVAIQRLISDRSMNENDARARLAVQMTNEERAQLCDITIENTGSIETLYARVEAVVRERLGDG